MTLPNSAPEMLPTDSPRVSGARDMLFIRGYENPDIDERIDDNPSLIMAQQSVFGILKAGSKSGLIRIPSSKPPTEPLMKLTTSPNETLDRVLTFFAIIPTDGPVEVDKNHEIYCTGINFRQDKIDEDCTLINVFATMRGYDPIKGRAMMGSRVPLINIQIESDQASLRNPFPEGEASRVLFHILTDNLKPSESK